MLLTHRTLSHLPGSVLPRMQAWGDLWAQHGGGLLQGGAMSQSDLTPHHVEQQLQQLRQ